jgi:hypothetical protein
MAKNDSFENAAREYLETQLARGGQYRKEDFITRINTGLGNMKKMPENQDLEKLAWGHFGDWAYLLAFYKKEHNIPLHNDFTGEQMNEFLSNLENLQNDIIKLRDQKTVVQPQKEKSDENENIILPWYADDKIKLKHDEQFARQYYSGLFGQQDADFVDYCVKARDFLFDHIFKVIQVKDFANDEETIAFIRNKATEMYNSKVGIGKTKPTSETKQPVVTQKDGLLSEEEFNEIVYPWFNANNRLKNEQFARQYYSGLFLGTDLDFVDCCVRNRDALYDMVLRKLGAMQNSGASDTQYIRAIRDIVSVNVHSWMTRDVVLVADEFLATKETKQPTPTVAQPVASQTTAPQKQQTQAESTAQPQPQPQTQSGTAQQPAHPQAKGGDIKQATENLRIAALLDEYVIIKSEWLLLDGMLPPAEQQIIMQEVELFKQSGKLKGELERDLTKNPPITRGEFEKRENGIKNFYNTGKTQTRGLMGVGQYFNYGGAEQNIQHICNICAGEIQQLRTKTKHPAAEPTKQWSQELKTLVEEKNTALIQKKDFDPTKEQKLRALLAEHGEVSCQQFRGEKQQSPQELTR